MDKNDGISEIYQILSNLLLTDLNDMLILTREQCIDENKKVYEDLLKSLLKINNERELESFYTNMVAINKIEKFDDKFFKSLSTACGILERIVGNTLASAKKCVQNFEYIIKKNTKHDPKIDTSINTPNVQPKKQPRKSLPVSNPSQSLSQISDKSLEKIDEILNGVIKSSQGSLDCPLCPYKTFHAKLHLRAHLLNHFPRDNINTFKCKYCNYYLSYEYSIKNHERLHNQNSTNVTDQIPKASKYAVCELCPYKTTNSVEFARHKKNHVFKENAKKCRYCCYYLFNNIHVHERLHEEYEPLDDEEMSIRRLEAINDAANIFFCSKCPFKTNSEYNLTGHMKYHEYREGCSKCRYCDFYNRDLKSHEILHPEYELKQEDEIDMSDISKFYDNLDQIDNLKRKREQSTNRDSAISASNSMKCEKCPFETKKINCFQDHVRNHQPRDEATKCRYCDYMLLTGMIRHEVLHPEYEPQVIIEQEIKCTFCPYKALTKDRLAKHLSNHTTTSGNFCCRYCTFFVAAEHNITKHEMLHAEYEPRSNKISNASPRSSTSTLSGSSIKLLRSYKILSCKVCPYKTPESRSFRMHMIRHNAFPGAIKCNYCDFYVTQRYVHILGKHIKLHVPKMSESKEDLQCKVCPYKGYDRKSIRIHNEKHTYREGAFKCRYCLFYCYKKHNLLDHERLHVEMADENVGDLKNELSAQNENEDEEEDDEIELMENENSETSKLYGCNMCPYKSASSGKVKIHTQRHDAKNFPENSLKCKVCSYRSMSSKVLSKHQKLHLSSTPVVVIKQESYPLNVSPIYTSSLKQFSKMNDSRSTSPFVSKDTSVVGSPLYDITKCIDNSIQSSTNLNEKSNLESSDIVMDESNSTSTNNQQQSNETLLFKCPHCPYKPSSAEFLQRHLQRHIFKENCKRCKYCPYFSSNLKNMRRHEFKHELNMNRQLSARSNQEPSSHNVSEQIENIQIIKECLNELIESVEDDSKI